ncbi:hypothetical protein ScPMuIL_002426 [Solemya velum]
MRFDVCTRPLIFILPALIAVWIVLPTANAQCDGTPQEVTADVTWQTIKTPDYDGSGIASNTLCSWIIRQGTPGSGVAFIAHDINPLIKPDPADLDFYEGDSNGGTRMNYANEDISTEIAYTENKDGFIELETGSNVGQKFQITYFTPQDHFEACGTLLYADDDPTYLNSENFPGPYPRNHNCAWDISSGSESAVVSLEFIWINIASASPTDCDDYVEIYYGKQSDNPTPTAKICPTAALNDGTYHYTSTAQYLSLKLTTNFFGSASGFLAQFTSNNAVINELSFFEGNTLSTPGFDTSYVAYMDYRLKITDGTGEAGVKILIDIRDVDVPCTAGTEVNVYDGDTDVDPSKLMAGDKCGGTIQRSLISTGNTLFLRFRTGAADGKGFKLTYISVKDSSGSSDQTQTLQATASFKFLSSPAYPSSYPSNADRVYVISSGHQKTSVSLSVLFVELSAPCASDNLKIYDGSLPDDPALTAMRTYCSDSPKWVDEVLKSSGESLTVTFSSDSILQSRGFWLKYWVEPHCPVDVSALTLKADFEVQQLISPGFATGKHATYLDCGWTITSDLAGVKILFQLTKLEFPCSNSATEPRGLSFYDGADIGGTMIREEMCHLDLPDPMMFTSPSGSLFVRYQSADDTDGAGFQLKYIAAKDFSGTSDTQTHQATADFQYISSPNYPSPFVWVAPYTYTHVISSGHAATPVVVDILVVKIGGCDAARLEIADGDKTSNPSAPELGRFCDLNSMSSQARHTSSGQYLTAVFTTSAANVEDDEGFFLRYYIEPHCPVDVSALTLKADFEVQQLISPGFATGKHATYLDCGWTITSDLAGVKILFQLTKLEFPCSNSATEPRGLSFYDGADTGGTMIREEMCHLELPNPMMFTAPSGSLFVRYQSADDTDGAGFQLKYIAAKDFSGTSDTQTHQATADFQYISSPNYPSPFVWEAPFTYTHVISSGHAATPVVVDILVVKIGGCDARLEIADGDKTSNPSAPELGRFCDLNSIDNQARLTSSGQYLTAVFTTTAANVEDDEGFFLRYHVLPHCPVATTEPIMASSVPGELKSPGYDENSYPLYLSCAWTIAGLGGAPVLVQIWNVGLGDGTSLSIYNGEDDSAPALLNAYSGTGENLAMVVADSGKAHITMTTVGTLGGPGFLAKYLATMDHSGSGGPLVATDEVQYISTPLFPAKYDIDENKIWVISTNDPTTTVKVTILFLDVVASPACAAGDSWEMFDGRYMSGMEFSPTLVTTVCIQNGWTALEFQGTGDTVSLVLRLDSVNTNNGHGFLMSYTQITNPYSWNCLAGPQTLEASLEIAFIVPSASTTGQYLAFQDCTWTIKATNPSMKILFQIVELDIPCNTNAGIFVFDGQDEQSDPLLQYVCGQQPLLPLASTGNSLFIRFNTLSITGGTGFNMTYLAATDYSKSATTDLQLLTATLEKQYLSSPQFPGLYTGDTERQYVISSGHKDTIVHLGVLFIEVEADCAKDKVIISDGMNPPMTTTILQTFCSSQNSWQERAYKSTGQYLSVTMTTDGTENKHGFLMFYYVERHCPVPSNQRVLTADLNRATFLSPGYNDGGFPTFLSCEWVIQATDGDKLLLQVTDVDVPCEGDTTIKITEGTDILQDNICQKEGGHPVINSNTGRILVTMTTGGVSNAKGFKLLYLATSDHSGDGEPLIATVEDKYISSPLFPQKYIEPANVTWLISSGGWFDTVTLEIVFLDISFSTDCVSNVLNIFDGDTRDPAHSPRAIASICGEADWNGTLFASTSQYISVVMSIGVQKEMHGFLAKYKVISGTDPGPIDVPQVWMCPEATKVKTAEKAMQFYSFPGSGGKAYETNVNCNWTVEAEMGWLVLADIEVDIPCDTGADLSITDDLQALAKYQLSYGCGQNKDLGLFVGKTGELHLRFRSLFNTSNNGFGMRFMAVKDFYTTADRLQAQQDPSFLSSKNFPLMYPKSVDHRWVINSGSAEDSVVVDVIFVDIQTTSGCSSDSLVFFDDEKGEKEIIRFCSGEDWRVRRVNSSAQYMTVLFISDDVTEKSGFLLQYRNVSIPVNNKGNRDLLNTRDTAVSVLFALYGCLVLVTFVLMLVLCNEARKSKGKSPAHFELYDLSRTNQNGAGENFEREKSLERPKPYAMYDEERARPRKDTNKHSKNNRQFYKEYHMQTPKWIQMLNSYRPNRL